MALIILLIIIALAAVYFVSCQRQFVDLKEKIKNSLSNIGVEQKSRWDALLQIAKAAKSYKEHEAETLIGIAKKRTGKAPSTVEEVKASEEAFSGALSRLMVVVESYPELKASELYSKTMNSIDSFENKVRISRQVYNDCITKYNRMVKQIPSSFVASILHYEEEKYLEFSKEIEDMPNLDL